MNAQGRKKLATLLKKGRHKWSMRLPADAGTFYGKRINFVVSPLVLNEHGKPSLTIHEKKLIEEILENLPKFIRKAEKEWWTYHGDPDFAENVSNPHIWINHEDQAGEDRRKWTFVVELHKSSYAWHIEFKGKRFYDIWSGS